MKALRLLGFAVLCLLVSPLIILATTLYSLRIFFVVRPRGISGTAYEPLWSRLFLDELGLREDRASAKLAPHLPATSWSRRSLGGTARGGEPTRIRAPRGVGNKGTVAVR
jgi:hypothetical protein